jgi:hypothetical protein
MSNEEQLEKRRVRRMLDDVRYDFQTQLPKGFNLDVYTNALNCFIRLVCGKSVKLLTVDEATKAAEFYADLSKVIKKHIA